MAQESLKVKAKAKAKIRNMADLTINNKVEFVGIKNPREDDNYAVATMKDQIIEKGRITNPPQYEVVTVDGKELSVLLRGNRRGGAAKELLADPSIPSDLKYALEHTECIEYRDLTPDERMSIIFDHGETKGLSRLEIVKAVWAMADKLKSESQIGKAMYYALAQFTRREDKLAECERITDVKARDKYISDWFRGTLGQYILAAQKMGPFVREQFLLTLKDESRQLKDDEHIVMRTDTKRVGELKKAMTADIKDGSWDAEKGSGNAFNLLVEKCKAEDAGTVEKDTKKRPTVTQLTEAAARYRSPIAKLALRLAAGEDVGDQTYEADEKAYLLNMKMEFLSKNVNTIDVPEVKALVGALLFGDAPSLESALKVFMPKS